MRILSLLFVAALAFAGCGDDDNGQTQATGGTAGAGGAGGGDVANELCPTQPELTSIEVETNIDSDQTWTNDNVYILNGLSFVTDATLTIEAGTLVVGGEGSALVVTTGANLITNGTADAPVVMTSINTCYGEARAAGDWGGLVLLGNAPINVVGGSNQIEGIDTSNPDVPDSAATYGGDDVDHNCGRLNYTRVEYAGFELTTDNELNGITLGGCGTATTLDYVQVNNGLDDGIEIFGGQPQLRHIVLSGIEDDSLDWDEGFQGTIQFLLIKQYENDADNGFEADNDKNANDAMPRSNPTILNATLIGSSAGSHGMVLRRGTYVTLMNTIVTGFPKFGIDIRDEAGANGATNGDLVVNNSLFFNNGDEGIDDDLAGEEAGEDDDDATFIEAEFFAAEALENHIGIDPLLEAWIPAADSPVAGAGVTEVPAGFEAVDYIGAFAPGGENWADGWTSFETE